MAFADWPQWRGRERNGHVPNSEDWLQELPAQRKVVWKLPVGFSLASPVVSEGRVFHMDNVDGMETLHAVDAADGTVLWSREIDEAFKDSQSDSGPRCTPVVDNHRVYAVSCRGKLQCRSVKSGELIWMVDFTRDFSAEFTGEKGNAQGAARHGNNGSPLVTGDYLVSCVGGKDGEGVICFDKLTGEVIWKSTSDPAAYAAPVRASLAGVDQVVCFTVQGLLGVRFTDGQLLWRIPVSTPYGRHVTTPVIWKDWVIAGSHEAGLIGIQVSSSNETEAEQVWIDKRLAMNFSSPVRVGRFVYGLGPDKNIICVEIPSGKLLWSREGYFFTSAGQAHAGFIGMGENVLMLTDGGMLVLFNSNPEQFQELGVMQACGMNWCNPAYSEGSLYLRDGLKSQGHLYRIQLKE